MDRVRMDKWLWAARFFKTRAQAGQACEMGHIESNGQPAKPAREVRVGDKLRVKTDGNEYEIDVAIVSDMRGPGAVAATMYVESEESKQRRAALAEARKLMPETIRPTKKDRRDINRWRGR